MIRSSNTLTGQTPPTGQVPLFQDRLVLGAQPLISLQLLFGNGPCRLLPDE